MTSAHLLLIYCLSYITNYSTPPPPPHSVTQQSWKSYKRFTSVSSTFAGSPTTEPSSCLYPAYLINCWFQTRKSCFPSVRAGNTVIADLKLKSYRPLMTAKIKTLKALSYYFFAILLSFFNRLKYFQAVLKNVNVHSSVQFFNLKKTVSMLGILKIELRINL